MPPGNSLTPCSLFVMMQSLLRERRSFEADWDALVKDKDTSLANLRSDHQQAVALMVETHAEAVRLLQLHIAEVCPFCVYRFIYLFIHTYIYTCIHPIMHLVCMY